MLGVIRGRDQLELHELHRFPNVPVRVLGTLHWDILSLFQGVLDGIGAAAGAAEVASVGIDTWGVDYGLLDEEGALLGNPVHYRDGRTDGMPGQVLAKVPPDELYAITGIQQLPFNTICQLAAAAATSELAAARTLLMIPDLLCYWLTGEIGAEATNASTTQLYDVRHPGLGHIADDPGGHPARHLPGGAQARGHHRGCAARDRRRGRVVPRPCPCWRSARTTRRRRSPVCPPRGPASPTSPAAPGPWWGWSCPGRC
jgi:Sugar (pentulose and hexulose) kinases